MQLDLELVDVTRLELLLALVLVEPVRAEVLVLDLVLLLLEERGHHLVNCRLDLSQATHREHISGNDIREIKGADSGTTFWTRLQFCITVSAVLSLSSASAAYANNVTYTCKTL